MPSNIVSILISKFYSLSEDGAGVAGAPGAACPGIVEFRSGVAVGVGAGAPTTDLGALDTDAAGRTITQIILNIMIKPANPHVTFSTTSVVLCTPIIAFDDAKFEERPPPFD